MAKGKPADVEQIRQLVSAAVGADPQRGDQVAVAVRPFAAPDTTPIPFYETTWFALVARSGAALIGVLLVLLLAVRPLLKALRPAEAGPDDDEGDVQIIDAAGVPVRRAPVAALPDPATLDRQIGLARQLVDDNPESALVALRKMLGQSGAEAA
jgi:flagellar M-ring protein FliF